MDRYEATVRIEKGDSLESLLRDMDFAPDEIRKAVAALKPVLKGARLPAGETITLQVQTPSQADGKPILQTLVIRPEARREITLERNDDGSYSASQRIFEIVTKLVRTSGMVNGSLRGSAEAAGIPPTVLAEMLRAFAWDVNLQYDVKASDRFAVLIEQAYTTDGRLVSPGRVMWARLTTGGGRRTLDAYRFKPDRGVDFFYYPNGESVVKSLLRTPMSLNRVSSRYGMRDHPILGFSSMHTGVDFAAPYGTPVLAAGAGTVVAASPYGGYGNWAKIDHGGGVATGYAHLARYAPGIRKGAHVRQGQVIGFVGSTGLSTGPHLHFELHQKGRPVNPLNARATQRASLAGKDLERFRASVARTDRARDNADQIARR
jgi:murein DD-endopeptidase MepM/ murein hydrolase activator NlpD